MSVLVDEDREHFLGVLFLTVLIYRFSVDHDLLSRHSLWSLLHHLLLLHVAHSVLELHVRVVPNKHSLLSHNLLLLSLVRELTSVEILVRDAWLAITLQHVMVNENWGGVHQHRLAIRTLSWSSVLRRSHVLVKASGLVLHNLTIVEHRWHHLGLLLRIHIWLHVHLFPVLRIGQSWLGLSQLQFLLSVRKGTLITVRTISAAFKEFAFDGLVVVVLLLEIALEVLATLSLVVASTLVHSSAASASSVESTWHVWLHPSRLTLEVVITSTGILTTATTTIVVSRHAAILLESASEGSLLVAVYLTVRIWWPRLYGHSSHCCSFHMFGNGLIK